MKNAIVLGLTLCAALSGTAGAEPYVGLDANHYSLTLGSASSPVTPQSAGGATIRIGDRFGIFAGELGYGDTTYTGNTNFNNLRLTRLTGDGLIYVPVLGGFNFLVTAGGVETNYGISSFARNYYQVDGKFKSSNADQTVVHGDEFDWRAGAGFSFGLDEFELRILARYQPLTMQNYAKDTLSADFGINYYF